MRSIRLSLIVYFLILLGFGLGAVCGLFYYTTSLTLDQKEESTRQLFVKEFQTKCSMAQAELDKQLLHQARVLSGRTRSSSVFYEPFLPLGALAAHTLPQGHLTVPLWVAEGFHPPLAFRLNRIRSYNIFLEGPHDELEDDPQYFQLFRGDNGRMMISSDSLEKGFEFALNEEVRAAELFVERTDTVEVNGKKLRRVTFKGNVPKSLAGSFPIKLFWTPGRLEKGMFRPSGPRPPTMEGPGEKGSHKFFPPPSSIIENPAPTFFLVAATDQEPLEKKFAGFQKELDGHLENLGEETREALNNLQGQLFLIALATFFGVGLGGFLLLLLGLRPLRRLSEAVSQVSEKDFQLNVGKAPLPVELQPIADRIKETLQLLEKAFAREKQASADISHELRTPLAALLTNLEVTLRKNRTPEQYREVLAECQESGRQMYHLVERLLSLARLDAGADRVRVQEVDLSHLARQCANLVKPLAENRGLTLKVHAEHSVGLDTDPDKVREILTNLLHNAIEYNRPQGSIDLSVARNNGHVELTVRDTGIGISPKAREHIFERFYRADPSRHADTPHAGLGLSIVKSYVDLMGGKIDVESSEAGSTFTISLPAKDKSPAAKKTPPLTKGVEEGRFSCYSTPPTPPS